MDKLKELMSLCKCSITIEINDHKDYYQTAERAFIDDPERYEEIDDEVKKIMVEKDTIISIQIYPVTPIGSYTVHHYDIDKCMDEALEILRNIKRKNNQ